MAPQDYKADANVKIFLAGSIEMGSAEDWQKKTIQKFRNYDVTFLNPRRDDWDSSWEQSILNPQFSEQVNWELDGMNNSDIIFMNFVSDTKSPITLLELGLMANSKKRVIVCCPEGFWRKGNVDIVCTRHKIPFFKNIKDAYYALEAAIIMENGYD